MVDRSHSCGYTLARSRIVGILPKGEREAHSQPMNANITCAAGGHPYHLEKPSGFLIQDVLLPTISHCQQLRSGHGRRSLDHEERCENTDSDGVSDRDERKGLLRLTEACMLSHLARYKSTTRQLPAVTRPYRYSTSPEPEVSLKELIDEIIKVRSCDVHRVALGLADLAFLKA